MTALTESIVTATSQPARWAVWAAHAAAVTPLPSSLWRIGLACGFPLGYTQAGYRLICPPGIAGPTYLVVLSVLTEIAALLTLGLVHRWGEVLPDWVPWWGGAGIPRLAAVLPASLGVVVLAGLWTPFLGWWSMPADGMTAIGHAVVGFVYLPLVAWAPLLAVATVAYHRRRSGE